MWHRLQTVACKSMCNVTIPSLFQPSCLAGNKALLERVLLALLTTSWLIYKKVLLCPNKREKTPQRIMACSSLSYAQFEVSGSDDVMQAEKQRRAEFGSTNVIPA